MSVTPSNSAARQIPFPDLCPVTEAVQVLAVAGIEERGAIFTRREVVDFILDLAGYTDDKPLHGGRYEIHRKLCLTATPPQR